MYVGPYGIKVVPKCSRETCTVYCDEIYLVTYYISQKLEFKMKGRYQNTHVVVSF